MTLRDLDIDVDVDVDASDLSRANDQADELIDTLRKLDDLITIRIDLDDGGATEELRKLKVLLEDLDGEDVHINVAIDDISNDLTAIRTQLQAIDSDSINIDVDISALTAAKDQADDLKDIIRDIDNLITIRIDFDDGGAMQKLRNFKLLVDELDGKRVRIHIDIDDITGDIANIHALLQTISRHSINIDADTTAAHAQLAILQAHILSLITTIPIGGPGISVGGPDLSGLLKMTGIILGLIFLLPPLASILQVLIGVLGVLGVAVGVVAGGLLALVSAVGVAAIGLGGFAALGIMTIIGLYDENAKLNAEQKKLKKQTDSVMQSWKDLMKTLQPFTFSAITSGVAAVNTLLDRSEPVLKNATGAVDGLFASFDKSLDSSAMQAFFSYLERSVGPLTTNIGNGLGYALQGILNTMTALEPLTSWIAQGFENMMGRFAGWTEGLSESERMKTFMQYVQDNLPTIGDIFGDMRDGIIDFFAAFDNTAVDGLGWMAEKMQDFAKWASELDDNKGFQDFLAQIKEDGPLVAELIGNISQNIISLIDSIADSGFLEFAINVTDPENFNFEGFAENFNLSSMFKPFWMNLGEGINWSEMFDFDFSGLFSKFESFDWSNYISKISWPAAIGHFVWDTFISKFEWPNLEGFSWKEFVEKFNWPSIAPFSWISFISKFIWPKIEGFSWSSFISKFKWPSLPAFAWPKISVSDLLGKVTGLGKNLSGKVDGSHSTGLGHVPFDGYVAQLHSGESVLTANQTEELRDLGVLQGYGASPTLDTSPLVSTTTVSHNNNGAATQIDVGGISISVQGGNTNGETAYAVREAIEEFFSELNIMMPVTREG